MAFGLTDEGFFVKRQEDILLELQDDTKDEYGDETDVDPRRPIGQLLSIFSSSFASLWALAEGVYQSQYPVSAQKVSLDNAVSLTNKTREPATFSTGAITITGTPAKIVLAGFKVHVVGDTTLEFETIDDATIEGGGTVDVSVRAVEAGEKAALAGTLTEIVNPESGVDSVTNALDIIEGQEVETDSELRERQQDELQAEGPGVDGLRTVLLNLDSVTEALVIENDSDITVDGRPPHSIECVVEGGTPTDITEAIFREKAGGIQTFGDLSESVTDSQGIPRDVYYSRPDVIEITVTVNITANSDPAEDELYPANGDDLVEQAVLDYGDSIGIGKDVFFNKIFSFINEVPGVIGISITGNKAGGPTVSDTIPIDPTELAEFDSSRITVNS